MAIEATHLNLFHPQLLIPSSRNFMNPNQENGYAYNNTQMISGIVVPEIMLPNSTISMNTESGLTFNMPANSRKRQRDPFNQFTATGKNSSVGVVSQAPPSCFDDDVLPLLQQYQLELDLIISHHTKKIKMELEEKQRQQARLLMAAMGDGVMKKLKEKDEQILKMGRFNLALQEKMKSLYMENQLWKDMAHTNEAAANNLRANLEQALAHVTGGAAMEDDAESCCGSTGNEDGDAGAEVKGRVCRGCGERESSVLLLPCRHLCLCGVCGSALVKTCPVCNSSTTATLHVNIS